MNIDLLLTTDGLLPIAEKIFEVKSLGYRVTAQDFEAETIETLGFGVMLVATSSVFGSHYEGGHNGGSDDRGTGRSYWEKVKHEMNLLLCTKDRKYARLRTKMKKTGEQTQLAVVSAVAAAVSKYVGLDAALLVPACALVLLAVLRLGVEALCTDQKFDVRVK